MTNVLVLDGNFQSSLSIVRSLRRRGIEVTAGAENHSAPACQSKYATGEWTYPNPDDGYEPFLSALEEFLATTPHGLVIPVSDKMTALLAKHKARIEQSEIQVACEEWDTFVTTYDKSLTFELAATVGVPAPQTWSPNSESDIDTIAEEATFPLIIKSRSKSIWTDEKAYEKSLVDDSHYVGTPHELRSRYSELCKQNPAFREYPPLVQEYVPGETQTTVLLADKGETVVDFQEYRLRTTPPSGGNSTLLRGVNSRQMRDYAHTLVTALDWTGPVQVEFMKTADGDYKLIEINGRYWGSLPLAISCGVDFPWLHYQLCIGETPDPPNEYRTDLKQRRLFGDIKWLASHLLDRNYAAIWPFCKSFTESKHTFVSFEDPKPTVATLQRAAVRGFNYLSKIAGNKIRSSIQHIHPSGPVSSQNRR